MKTLHSDDWASFVIKLVTLMVTTFFGSLAGSTASAAEVFTNFNLF